MGQKLYPRTAVFCSEKLVFKNSFIFKVIDNTSAVNIVFKMNIINIKMVFWARHDG